MRYLIVLPYMLLGFVLSWAGITVVDNPLQFFTILIIVSFIDLFSYVTGKRDE